MTRGWMLAVLMAGSTAALAAQGTDGAPMVSGRVFDDSTGCPLKGAQLTVVGSEAHALSDANGRYRLAGLPSAPFSFRAMLPGYRPRQSDSVVVTDSTARVDFSLLRSMGDSARRVAYPAHACRLEPAGTP